MTLNAYIVFAIVLILAIQYNKLIDRERMYKQYYNYALKRMDDFGIDPKQTLKEMKEMFNLRDDLKLAQEAIEDAFVHYFRCRGVIIENLKIYWNEPN